MLRLAVRDMLDAEAFSGPSGTGGRFGRIVLILAGISALSATLLTFLSVYLQSKNYRKPLLQRYVIRILLMVPIYSAASWASLISTRAAFWIDPFRDVYEAFTIYTFFQLLINFLGGERALIIMMNGRRPVSHLWPLTHVLEKIDISDPHTFLAVKRGILQYTWVKPLLAVATIIMKATDTYQEGYFGLTSGYMWSGLLYNISITVSLYTLALFWVCMSADLQPFRPMPKFLSIKGIIFASYWQGFFLSILVWLRAIPDDVKGYTADNLAAAIQDALICFEMPAFALAHWYAFSWHDFADVTISAARMPIRYALRDAFGPVDLIMDSKQTFSGAQYEYRHYDAYDGVIAHEQSSSREARMKAGMRYERGGKGKYWIPDPSSDRSPLLASGARTMDPAQGASQDTSTYGTASAADEWNEPTLSPEDERLYDSARALEFGDWNYPVITANTASREAILYKDPTIITSSTNRHVLQPTAANRQRHRKRVKKLQAEIGQKKKGSSNGEPSKSKSEQTGKSTSSTKVGGSSSASSSKSGGSQLVDLVVEDHEAEEIERVRARKEGGAEWNESEARHFVRAYPAEEDEASGSEAPQQSRSGKQPSHIEGSHNLDDPFAIGDNADASGGEDMGEPAHGSTEEQTERRADGGDGRYGSFAEERNAWGGSGAE